MNIATMRGMEGIMHGGIRGARGRTDVAGGEGEGFEELGAVRGVGGRRAALVVQAAHRRQVLAVLKHLKRRLRRQLRPLHAMRRVCAARL